MTHDFDDDFCELEGIIDEAIFASRGGTITADSIATAILAPLEMPSELSHLYSETHKVLAEVAKSSLKELFDPEFRYGISCALAVIKKDPERLRRISAAMQQEAGELERFMRQKFGDAAVDARLSPE
jgi:hypothetical protein